MSTTVREKEEKTPSCCGTCGCRAAVAVDPRMSAQVRAFLDEPRRAISLVETFGSPLNVVFPQQPAENLRAFEQVLAERRVSGRVLCTSKPNRSRALLSSLAHAGAWLDVSSRRALAEALASGIPGDRIQATGPKTVEYLALAVAHGSYVTVDNPAELQMLESVRSAVASAGPAKAIIRIRARRSSFRANQEIQQTFGSTEPEVSEMLAALAAQKQGIAVRGFHFHIHGASNAERRDTFEVAFGALRRARQLSLSPDIINIGGGYKIRYADSDEQWGKFNEYLKRAVRSEVKPITWQNDGLGYRLDSRGVTGAPQFTDHAPKTYGPAELDELLAMPCPQLDDQPIGRIVSDAMIQLWVEPGRAIVDQSGITLARVAHTTQSEGERPLIRLEMNQSNLRSSQQKLITQPIVIPRQPRKMNLQGMFLLGNLCVAQDVLQPNTVYPGFIPEHGDVVAFINTAPYLMDFIESEMLLQPTARKVAVLNRGGIWKTVLDDEFSAVRFALEN